MQLNAPEPIRQIDGDNKIEIYYDTSVGEFVAYFFFDSASRMYDGSGQGPTIEEACRAALEDVE